MDEPTLLQQARQLAAEYRNAWPGSDVVECILQHLEQREAAMSGPAHVPGEPRYRLAVERGADGFATLVAKPEPASTADAWALDLDELQRLCDAATPGPWRLDEYARNAVITPRDGIVAEWGGDPRLSVFEQDGAFIAAARDALPKLIAKVREQSAELDYYRAEAGEDDHG